jgi:prepilin-type N-terminal cleavage/methylation domain-containing protein
MNMNSSIIQDQIDGEKDDKGFTLIEILIAIVLVGILSAVAVVGISSLVSKGTGTACSASRDSANSASAVYFAANANAYPTTFVQLTGANGSLTLPADVQYSAAAIVGPPAILQGNQASSGGWKLSMIVVGGTSAPNFVCS